MAECANAEDFRNLTIGDYVADLSPLRRLMVAQGLLPTPENLTAFIAWRNYDLRIAWYGTDIAWLTPDGRLIGHPLSAAYKEFCQAIAAYADGSDEQAMRTLAEVHDWIGNAMVAVVGPFAAAHVFHCGGQACSPKHIDA